MFEVLDKDNKKVTAHEVMLRHADFFGNPEHKDFVFALGEDGELMVISGQMPLRMACTLRAFAHLYTVRHLTPRAADLPSAVPGCKCFVPIESYNACPVHGTANR